jgi:hypothetical protein
VGVVDAEKALLCATIKSSARVVETRNCRMCASRSK